MANHYLNKLKIQSFCNDKGLSVGFVDLEVDITFGILEEREVIFLGVVVEIWLIWRNRVTTWLIVQKGYLDM